jgi:hypothetical protein
MAIQVSLQLRGMALVLNKSRRMDKNEVLLTNRGSAT